VTTDSTSGGQDANGPGTARRRLEAELARLRERRRELAEAASQPDVGDRADEAAALERRDELAAIDDRIDEVSALLAGRPAGQAGGAGGHAGIPSGTTATLRFDDGTVQTVRAVAIPEEIPPGQEDTTMTTDSPLGLALAGHRTGDTISYQAPGGEVRARILSLDFPGNRE
jgi:transcription elongation factor GreA